MAYHGPAYGFSAEVQKKLAASYDVGLERNLSAWITAVTGERQTGSFADWLKSGVVLCNLANKLNPGSAPAPSASKMPFVQMENINKALEAFRRTGVQDTEMFMTVDLYEAKNMSSVLLTLAALDRAAQRRGYRGPKLNLSGTLPSQVPLSESGGSPGVSEAFRPAATTSPARSAAPAPVSRGAPAASSGAPRFCPGCGGAWTAGARFCPNCGSPAP